MTKVQKLEQEIQKLNREELDTSRNWFRKYDFVEWDCHIEKDIHLGRLDSLAGDTLVAHSAGKTREL